ncbi:hypothetical protein GQ54DRAFT_294767 [Martensiomyces pterosporus]|nr:hypothetical protein GQ54DRAFT_294767 [Martensiomyces pterosporus]
MRINFGILLAAASALMNASAVVAAPASVQPNLIVFGNSLSDTGNTVALTHGQAYWNGRYSNSYVWNEYTAKLLGYKLENHAYGGATSNNILSPVINGNITIPSFHDQVAAWLSKNPNPSSFNLNNDVIQVEIGGNDIFHRVSGLLAGTVNVQEFISQLASSIANDVQTLVDAGYKNIDVWSLPAVDKAPIVTSVNAGALVKPLVAAINTAISNAINKVASKNSSKTQGIHLFDLNGLMAIGLNPQVLAALGVTDSADACYVKSASGQVTICSNPDQYFFYDSIHPASRMHYLWGIVAAILTRNPTATIDIPAALSLIKTFDIHDSSRDNNIVVGSVTGPESSAIPPASAAPATYTTSIPTSTAPVVVPTSSQPPRKCH